MNKTCLIELLLSYLFSTIRVTYTLTILIKVFKDITACESKVPSQICTAATEATNLIDKYWCPYIYLYTSTVCEQVLAEWIR